MYVTIFRFIELSIAGVIVSAQATEILSDDRIDLPRLYIFQHFLEARPLEIESGETVIHIVIKDAEPILFAELAQHHLLCFYTHALADLFIILAQATIDCCSSLNVESPPSESI